MQKLLTIVFCTLSLLGCGGGSDSNQIVEPPSCSNGNAACPVDRFTTGVDYIYKDGIQLDIKGVVYVPGQPGYLPWEIESLSELPADLTTRIDNDIAGIKVLGANTIRFWGAPAYCYQAVKTIGGLNILQTIWFDGAVIDFQDATFKQNSKNYIKQVVDRIYSVYTDNNPPIVAFLVGNELSDTSIRSTNQAHPNITSYSGNHFSATMINASEAFIAEMADYLRGYELETYGNSSLISYANEIRTIDLIDTAFLDFRSQNVYSYAVPYYRPQTQPGSTSGTFFQGWVEELKDMYPDVPLLITETGLSVSPNAIHTGPPNYGYGGNTELEQAAGIMQNLYDLKNATGKVAGVSIHEYLDAWWKFGLNDSYSQDPDDIEEWFGIVKLINENGIYNTQSRPVFDELQLFWTNP